jgi:hypothetical protein
MTAIGAANSGEALRKVLTFQVLPNYTGKDRTEEAIFTRVKIVVPVLELIKVIIEQFPQWRFPRFSAPIYFRFGAPIHWSSFVLLTNAAM